MTATIFTLADLRRALAMPGLTMTVVDHWQPQLVGTTRCVKQIRNGRPGLQGNGHWFEGPDRDGKIRDTFAPIPRASQMGFDGSDCVTWYPGETRSWKIRFSLPAETR